jgi:hypothetical protein
MGATGCGSILATSSKTLSMVYAQSRFRELLLKPDVSRVKGAREREQRKQKGGKGTVQQQWVNMYEVRHGHMSAYGPCDAWVHGA